MVTKLNTLSIVGPTASGKTKLAIELAEKYSGEIICADSRTIYRELDIGTAKPSKEDRSRTKHHALDIIYPDESYSAGEFQKLSEKLIIDIKYRNNLPVIVGGSGLYFDGLLYGFNYSNDDNEYRDKTLIELREISNKLGLQPTDETFNNPRHLASFVRNKGRSEKKEKIPGIIFGIEVDFNVLEDRISQRVEQMFNDGLVEETKAVLEKYGQSAEGLKTLGYPIVIDYLNSKITLKEAKEKIVLSHRQLAKKQMTWFRRNEDINWVTNFNEIEQIILDKN